jgi:hypothetical protein
MFVKELSESAPRAQELLLIAIDLVGIRFVLGDTGRYFDGDLLVTQGNL